ncbi:MarR family transcriptional regulator [Uruburuella suis]|jgi:MarR family transcriptional repressor of emrRAB|uniref:MarR family transcriptional regulator n=1 Tax=Uruburuella suis TaxID=252130 RepID=A0AAE9GY74_9NEIS|nr:MarR family transcriptional regulator [Uruburuella suis]MBP6393685.1 MarR family transcriptional regulator [Neisseria sp.]MBP7259477.1 MarR family transcriptional regulator [Neisseria sp.]MBP7968866.1 MarR family transcriptional regulator [Neisseria sp.]MBP8025257.1 MarR family transcriptional regulator [Neisseria sp.]MBP8875477.1 MarR family transcriptional regulator [Neisseria sp.]
MSFSQAELTNALRLLSERLPEFSEPQAQISRLLRVVTERLSGNLNESLKEFGINENLWFAVMAVYVSPDSEILPSRLSDLMDLTRTSATRLSDDMVERGWVERHINQQDRRQIVLKLTAEGEAFIQKVWPQIANRDQNVWEAFAEEDYAQLHHLLSKLLTRLGG